MPSYPDLPGLPPDGLVPPDRQPTYLDLPGEELASEVNLCAEIVDRNVAVGRGDRPAITFADDGTVLTFGELQVRTQAVAGALVALGVEVGDRVGVRYPNRPDGIIAMLAAWRAGAAVVPVPPQARA
jgi:2-aminobenzoate-CoA ligase